MLPRPDWEDLVHLGVDEIRQYGERSIQVARRLKYLLEDLLTVAPLERRTVLIRQLTLLEHGIARAFPERDLTFRGRVVSVDGDVVALEIEEVDDTGAVLMPATARVRLPRRSDA